MLDAARFDRTRRLLKATAFVQQTLRDVFSPEPGAETPHESPDSVVEGTFRVVEPDKPSGRGPDRQEVEVIITTVPTPEETAPTFQPSPVPVSPKESAAANPATEILPPLSELPLPLRFPRRLRQDREEATTPPPISTPPQTDEPGPDKGRFLSQSYANEAGTRAYKLYVPGGYHGQALPLVVMLHGCTQSPDDFAAATRMNEFAETYAFLVAYPAQPFKANLGKCWNWFKSSEQQRDRGEPAVIASLTRQVIKSYGLDPQRVYIAGISAGGAMAMVMGITYPDLYAAVGIQSGVAYGVAHNVPSGLAAIKGRGSVAADRLTSAPKGQVKRRVVPTIVFHGDRDSIVHPSNSEQIIGQWLKIRAEREPLSPTPQVTVQSGQVPAGHAYTRSIYHDGDGLTLMEQWLVHGAGHAWSGGSPQVMFTDAKGPDATQEMLRFFYEHPHPEA
jgi:poly(hydroxyalkanoate) depolymerase family esterase